MRGESLDALLLSDVPELRESVASTGDELVVVERVNAQAHYVAEMVGEFMHLGASLQIPQHTGHVTRRCENTLVGDESAATEVARVAGQLACHTCWTFPSRQIVDGADVIETTTGDVVAGRGVGAGHDPRRAQRDGVDLVGRVGVPDDELSVLRGGNEMSAVGGPVHGVDFSQMALEGALRLHGEARQGLDTISGDIANCALVLAVYEVSMR